MLSNGKTVTKLGEWQIVDKGEAILFNSSKPIVHVGFVLSIGSTEPTLHIKVLEYFSDKSRLQKSGQLNEIESSFKKFFLNLTEDEMAKHTRSYCQFCNHFSDDAKLTDIDTCKDCNDFLHGVVKNLSYSSFDGEINAVNFNRGSYKKNRMDFYATYNLNGTTFKHFHVPKGSLDEDEDISGLNIFRSKLRDDVIFDVTGKYSAHQCVIFAKFVDVLRSKISDNAQSAS